MSDTLESLSAFRPDWTRECEVCGQKPVVSATGLCGPHTFGEADTLNGAWWSEDDEQRYQAALAEGKRKEAEARQ